MRAFYTDKRNLTIVSQLGRYDIESLRKGLPVVSANRLGGTGERIFISYSHRNSPEIQAMATKDPSRIDLQLPTGYSVEEIIALDGKCLSLTRTSGLRDERRVLFEIKEDDEKIPF